MGVGEVARESEEGRREPGAGRQREICREKWTDRPSQPGSRLHFQTLPFAGQTSLVQHPLRRERGQGLGVGDSYK